MVMAISYSIPTAVSANQSTIPTNRLLKFRDQTNPNLLSSEPQYGGELIWGTSNPPSIINPILTHMSVSTSLVQLIFNGLVKKNPQGEIIPSLAESWDISDDHLTYTFYLRKNVRFHDGVELTAEDVKFTYELIVNDKVDSIYRSSLISVSHFDVLDKYTIRIVLKKDVQNFIHQLVRFIVPKHLLENEDVQNTKFNYQPIGSGPFKFQNWDKITNEIELVANKDYFEGRPYLDSILIKQYPNKNALWSALMRNEVDLVLFLSKKDYNILKDDPSYNVYRIPLEFNCAIIYNTQDAILNDFEVRKAIAHSIDRKKLISDVSIEGLESVGPLHPDALKGDHLLNLFEYNPHKAKVILMHRGWRDDNKDGILEKEGRDLEIKLLVYEQNEDFKKIVQVLHQRFADVGIKLSVLLYNDNLQLTDEFLQKHKPQAWIRFLSSRLSNKYVNLGYWYSQSSEFGRLWKYENKKFDEIYESGLIEKDVDERYKLYEEMHDIIYKDQPASFLFVPVSYHAVSEKFRNVDALFKHNMAVYTLSEWYLE